MRINIDSLTPIKVARHYDGAADVIEFDVCRWIEAYPALTEYRVEVTSPGGAVYFPETVNLDGHVLKWTIMPSDTGTAGNGEYQIIATGSNGERKTSASARFVVREIMEGTAGETPPDPAQPWVEKVLDAAQKVEDATVHPPVIGENGNWWLWDFDAAAYVDSGKPSQGSGSGGGGIAQETDPTVPEWAKQPNPPTAPVQSVNGKTGDVKLNAADVGAASGEELARLNEEKADQFTVGEGLTMSEDRVLSAVPAGVYEPIMTIEVTSENQSIVVDETPDGREWNFSAIMVFIELNGGAMSQPISINFWGKPNFGDTVFGYTIEASSGNKCVRCEMYIDRGVWKGEFTNVMTGNAYYGSQDLVAVSRDKPVQEYPAIYGISTSKWPVGTTLDIYGVWKDE